MNEAYKRGCANKGAGGVDGMEIGELEGYKNESGSIPDSNVAEQIKREVEEAANCKSSPAEGCLMFR